MRARRQAQSRRSPSCPISRGRIASISTAGQDRVHRLAQTRRHVRRPLHPDPAICGQQVQGEGPLAVRRVGQPIGEELAWAQFWAHSLPSAAVHRWPLGTRPRWPRTVADIGERRPAVLESVLGASPREFESRILRRADLQGYRWWPLASGHIVRPWAHLMGSFPSRGRAAGDGSRHCCAWSRRPRTDLNGGAHAAVACWRPPLARTRRASRSLTGQAVSRAAREGACYCQPAHRRAGRPGPCSSSMATSSSGRAGPRWRGRAGCGPGR